MYPKKSRILLAEFGGQVEMTLARQSIDPGLSPLTAKI